MPHVVLLISIFLQKLRSLIIIITRKSLVPEKYITTRRVLSHTGSDFTFTSLPTTLVPLRILSIALSLFSRLPYSLPGEYYPHLWFQPPTYVVIMPVSLYSAWCFHWRCRKEHVSVYWTTPEVYHRWFVLNTWKLIFSQSSGQTL